MALTLEIKPAEGPLSRVRLQPGNNRFSVRVGDTYRIFDDQTGLTPPGIAVKRIDESLVVDGLPASGGEPVVVEFAEFYRLCSVGSPCELQVQHDAASAPVAITPGTATIGALADGSFVLYDPSYVAPPEPADSAGSVNTRTVLYGVGALAVGGLALGGGGGGGGDGGSGSGPAPPDGTLKLTSPTSFNNRTPVIRGEGEPGAKIVVRIDTDGDGVPNVTYGTTVGVDFLWSVNLASAAPESGALPATGLPDISTVGITSASANGNFSLAPFQFAFDATPPASAAIDVVATDNIVNAAEREAGVTVTGSAEPFSTVLVNWGAQGQAVAVDAAGRWAAVFAATAVPGDGTQPITAVAQDAAGNSAPATGLAVAIDTVPSPLTVASVAGGDGVVSIADAGRVRFAGETEAGATVNVDWSGRAKPATVGADGRWEVEFVGDEVHQGGGESIAYTIVATDVAGNTAQAGGQVMVDRVAPTPPAIGVVAGDDRVAVGERGSVNVTGSSEAGAKVTVSWGGASRTADAGGDGAWTASFSGGDVPSVASPGATTNITATATDPAGNTGAPVARAVFVEQPFPPPTIAIVEGNDVVNAAERAGGVLISGSVHPAAPGVTVTWGGFSGAAIVSNGNWQLNVPAGSVPPDGNTTVTAAITGSPEISATRTVSVDATAPAGPGIGIVEGDDRVTLAERADGVRVSGNSEANARISVAWSGIDKVATADGNGNWFVDYAEGEVPDAPIGGANFTVTAFATDGAGNAGVASQRAVFVEAPFPAPVIAAVEGNDVVSAAERADGVVVSGTVQPGAPGVNVAWGGFNGAAAVTGGTWSITVPADQVPGDGVTSVVAAIAGTGGASAQRTVTVDTTGPAVAVGPVSGDNVVSLVELFVVTGTSEANATVVVSLGGQTLTANADAAGAWTTGNFIGGLLPLGTVALTATATDPQGNAGPSAPGTIQVAALPTAIMPQELLATDSGSPSAPAIAPPPSPLAPLPADPLAGPLLGIDDPVRHLG